LKTVARAMIPAILVFSLTMAAAQSARQPRILILNSYHRGYPWTDEQNEGAFKVFKETGLYYDIHAEYLDWKRFPSADHLESSLKYFRRTYAAHPIDVILTTDDRALQFALDHRDEVFSAAPVVFGGVYPDDAARMIEGKDKVTGVYQRMDIEGTLRTALAIQPNPQAVYVINELSESGHGTEREMERVVSAMLPGIEMVSLSQLSLDEIKQVVSTLNQTSILIIGSYGFDRDRAIHHPEVLAREVSRASAIPVHLLFSQGFGTGALGGSLLSGERQGEIAARLALRVLSGEDMSAVRPVQNPRFDLRYDFRAIRRFGIPISLFPPGAKFVNREAPFLELYRVEATITAIAFLALIALVMALAAQVKKVRRIAFVDQLTGLPNRAAAPEITRRMIAHTSPGKKCGLISIDIDNFKYVNDTFGHAAGDKVLAAAARALESVSGELLALARLGGDEFALVAANRDRKEIEALASSALAALGQRMTVDGRLHFLTASAGIAVYPDNADRFHELLQNADAAMNRAKSAGKTQYRFYTVEMYRTLQERMDIELGLRSAIEAGEIFVVYQPQVRVASGRVEGFEALVRWKRPGYGVVSPATFIPVAEESGQIERIGLFVLTEAARFSARAEATGRDDFCISINVSAKQFNDPDFAAKMMRAVTEAGARPGHIAIELTESLMMESMEDVSAKLAQLRTSGFLVSLDDFGKGYSSLTYIKELPIDLIKMDKAFIDDMLRDERSRKLAKAIVCIAHDLGLRVVAEGVEVEAQARYLAEIDCDFIQGYYFSKPKPETDAIADLNRYF